MLQSKQGIEILNASETKITKSIEGNKKLRCLTTLMENLLHTESNRDKKRKQARYVLPFALSLESSNGAGVWIAKTPKT